MPKKTVHCRICGKAISGVDFAERMKKIRHHYKTKHPKQWKLSIKKGVEKRKRQKR